MEVDADSNYTPEERVTYPKIKEYIMDKYGVNVHTSYIAQVKRMCGLDMREHYNKFKKENSDAIPELLFWHSVNINIRIVPNVIQFKSNVK